VPQIEQHLHSIHCHLYLRTETIMFAVNCKHVGCPITRRTYARHGTRIWDGVRNRDASRKVPGQLSCAEEQWTPSYCLSVNHLFFFCIFSHVFRSDWTIEFRNKSMMFDKTTTHVRLYVCVYVCLSPFLSTKNVRNNDTSSCFRTEYFISWYL
jgi:hypothetical protein